MITAVLFYGAGPLVVFPWGGWITSLGIWNLGRQLRALGIDATCYEYGDVNNAAIKIDAARGPRLCYSYSLGNTASTLLQETRKLDLLFCIAESEYAGANNHPVVKANVKRSVLWTGPGSFSDAGRNLGFDSVEYSPKPHLLIDLAGEVLASALVEGRKAGGLPPA